MNHKQLIAGFTQAELAALTRRSDLAGLKRLVGHGAVIALLGLYVQSGLPGWPIGLVLYGICMIFLFTLLHETVHETPFRTVWINRLVGRIVGFILFIPCVWFRYFHLAHHRHTHDLERDPELESPKPQSVGAYLAYLSGIPIWISLAKTLWGHASGRVQAAYIPKKARSKIILEARLSLLAYCMLLLIGVGFGLQSLFWLWILPLLVGQPFLRAYLLAEHTDCPHVPNMLENTRTVFTLPWVRFIAWNMPYHAEHHSFPNVPFHRLPTLHQKISAHLQVVENGYVPFHRRKWSLLRKTRGTHP